jgi:hypothetical protein
MSEYSKRILKSKMYVRKRLGNRVLMPIRETYVAVRTCIVHVATVNDKKIYIHKHNL